jgi:C4-dicarboxylate-specific signal transduction histidine kinase
MLSRFSLRHNLFLSLILVSAIPIVVFGLWLGVKGQTLSAGILEYLTVFIIALLIVATISWWLARLMIRPIENNTNSETAPNKENMQSTDGENNLWHQEFQLSQAAQISAMNEIAAGMAHELNQPLTAITGYIDGSLNRLRDQSNASEKILVALEKASEQTFRAGEVIRQIRDKIQSVKREYEVIDINDPVRKAMALLRHEISQGSISLEVDLAENLPKVRVDNLQIQNLVLSLSQNGIEVMLGNYNQDNELTVSSYRQEDGQVAIAIKDNGPGLDSLKSAELFEPFFTTKRNRMGMGLSICRSIVDSHDGKIWCEKNDDKGVTFIFSLPSVRSA